MSKLTIYLSEVREEMSKVHWPAWAQLNEHTWVVIVISVLLAFTIWVFDRLLMFLLEFIL